MFPSMENEDEVTGASVLLSAVSSRLGSSALLQLGNDAFDIYSGGVSVPDALVVCSLFY